jgi:ABC-2 type transport system ATP-binding protein
MILASGLTRRFNELTAVDHIDLKVGEGEVFGFLGPNGAGKTTTVRMLTCLIKPTEGEALVCGYDIRNNADSKKIRKISGLLTENSSFYENLTVNKNLRFYSDLYKVSRHKAEKNIELYLKLFNLWEFRDAYIGGFSKGMRQKLALIRCLVHEPEILFLDEPTSGLDPVSARIVRDAMIQLKEEGKTIFLCTHNLDDAERLCDKIAIINKRIIGSGSPGELKNMAHRSKFVIRLEKVNEPVVRTISNSAAVKGLETFENSIVMEVEDPDHNNADIISGIVGAGGRILSVSELKHSLEEAYLKLVGDRCDT